MILQSCVKEEQCETEGQNMGQIGDNSQVLINAFMQNNRLDHVNRLIAYHPQYLEPFLKTQQFILKGDGPLPYDYRHFIAIMAAARHQCSYLVNLQKEEFIHQGGNEKWLLGLHHTPQKLRDLNEINKILAHRPWLMSKAHIEKLTKGKDNWSLSEVVHAIVLLAHFHAYSTLVYGIGAEQDPAVANGGVAENGARSDITGSPPMASDVGGEVEELMKKMKSISEQRSEQTTHEEMVKMFEKVESQSAELSAGLDRVFAPKEDVTRFVDDPDFIYQDFAKRGEACDIPTFRVQDYSWDDHGYSLVNRLYNDVGTLLDDKFKTAYSLTYYTMGRKNNVDTSMFRRAVWNYIQCMYGIRHDDYDYREVNELLDRNLKSFIKTVCCYPERTTKKDFECVLKEFRRSEKIHVNLMIIEAKLQAALLYALRAIMRYMT